MPSINRKPIRVIPERKPFEGVRQNNYDLYNSARWRSYRKRYLRNHPLCVMCEADGKVTEAYYLDHIVPINQGGSVWGEENHQGLCKHHNAIKTAKDGRNKGNQ